MAQQSCPKIAVMTYLPSMYLFSAYYFYVKEKLKGKSFYCKMGIRLFAFDSVTVRYHFFSESRQKNQQGKSHKYVKL